ncbi:MAG: class I SAM-dependent methyltransferase [Planctomycetes bacterium]|nr:class I SAM-dependent methyltransferase [Planctomycetota bacterium]
MSNQEAEDWAPLLKAEWRARARSPRGRFYVASHPGWQDDETWERQAVIDADFVLLGLDPEALARMKVLEIGCGNGRLARQIAPRVARYHGFDLCETYLAEARTVTTGLGRTRFLEGDGARIPAALNDERYDLIFAAAVFIHCPRPIVVAYLEQALPLLVAGGRFRFQVLADPEDGEGYVPLEALAAGTESRTRDFVDEVLADQADAREEELVEGSHYQGHLFRYRELLETVRLLLPAAAEFHVIRFDPMIFNCEIRLGCGDGI